MNRLRWSLACCAWYARNPSQPTRPERASTAASPQMSAMRTGDIGGVAVLVRTNPVVFAVDRVLVVAVRDGRVIGSLGVRRVSPVRLLRWLGHSVFLGRTHLPCGGSSIVSHVCSSLALRARFDCVYTCPSGPTYVPVAGSYSAAAIGGSTGPGGGAACAGGGPGGNCGTAWPE